MSCGFNGIATPASVRNIGSQDQHYKEHEHERDVQTHPADAHGRNQTTEGSEDRLRDPVDKPDHRVEPFRRPREGCDPRECPRGYEEPKEDVDDEPETLSYRGYSEDDRRS